MINQQAFIKYQLYARYYVLLTPHSLLLQRHITEPYLLKSITKLKNKTKHCLVAYYLPLTSKEG